MANRILRDTTVSENINKLSADAEVFFYRLIMKADDHGCYTGNPKLIRAALFPLKLDSIREAHIEVWAQECFKAKVIEIYQVDGKPYIQIINFGQRLRAMKSKFPLPLTNVSNPRTNVSDPPPETKRNETKPEEETKQNLKAKNLIDFFFNDFPTSSELERVSMVMQVPKQKLLSFLPDFKKAANLEYPNMVKFAEHFKNWYRINIADKENENPNKATSFSFNKKPQSHD